ncbi:MAG: hypothetical protein AAGH79_07665 [Bacteroidota bacterium]
MIKLGEATAEAIIQSNIDSIDLPEWMFTITSDEYAACAEGHQSAAQAVLPSGKRFSVNAEFVAGYFMVQHYIETVSEKDHVLAISPNTQMWLDDEHYVSLQITWELSATKIDEQTTKLTCRVVSKTANEQFAQASQHRSASATSGPNPLQVHINEETPLFAKDIERKAQAGIWN